MLENPALTFDLAERTNARRLAMPLAARMWQAVQCAEVTLDLGMIEKVLGSWKDVSDSFLTTRTNGLVHLTNLEASIRAAPEVSVRPSSALLGGGVMFGGVCVMGGWWG